MILRWLKLALLGLALLGGPGAFALSPVLQGILFAAPAEEEEAGEFTPDPIGISDDFDDASFNTTIWDSTTTVPGWLFGSVGGTRAEASGVLTVNPTDSVDTVEGNSSVNTFDFSTEKTIYVHLTTAPTNGTFSFGAWISSSAYIRFDVSNFFGDTNIVASKHEVANDETLMASTTWSATDHRWLAIHYNGSQWEAYTAPDSAGSPGTWTLQGSTTAAAFAVTALRVGAFGSSDDAASGDIAWDGFNTSD